jgi:hypothetical protein
LEHRLPPRTPSTQMSVNLDLEPWHWSANVQRTARLRRSEAAGRRRSQGRRGSGVALPGKRAAGRLGRTAADALCRQNL